MACLLGDLDRQLVEPDGSCRPGGDFFAVELGRRNVLVGLAFLFAPDKKHFLAEPGAVEFAVTHDGDRAYDIIVGFAIVPTAEDANLAVSPAGVERERVVPHREPLVVNGVAGRSFFGFAPEDAGPVVLGIIRPGDVERPAVREPEAEDLAERFALRQSLERIAHVAVNNDARAALPEKSEGEPAVQARCFPYSDDGSARYFAPGKLLHDPCHPFLRFRHDKVRLCLSVSHFDPPPSRNTAGPLFSPKSIRARYSILAKPPKMSSIYNVYRIKSK